MKQLQVRMVPYGETFSVFGDTFVALDFVDGNVLAIRKEIWREAPFDTDGKNDLRRASVTGHLVEYFWGLRRYGASEETVAMNRMDLKATDGTREYGTLELRAGLLTLEQYGKYQDIIPLAGDWWWWLATPWRTPLKRSPDLYNSAHAWNANPNGYASRELCSSPYGVRPALCFAPSLLVSIEEEG